MTFFSVFFFSLGFSSFSSGSSCVQRTEIRRLLYSQTSRNWILTNIAPLKRNCWLWTIIIFFWAKIVIVLQAQSFSGFLRCGYSAAKSQQRVRHAGYPSLLFVDEFVSNCRMMCRDSRWLLTPFHLCPQFFYLPLLSPSLMCSIFMGKQHFFVTSLERRLRTPSSLHRLWHNVRDSGCGEAYIYWLLGQPNYIYKTN